MDKNIEDVDTCSFCGKTSHEVDLLVSSPDGKAFICSGCVRTSEAMLVDHNRDDIYLFRIPGNQLEAQKEKLRPITRMPRTWLVYDVNLYAAIPYVTACDSFGNKKEDFSIPKQLVHWIITTDKTVDIDKLKEEIKKEIAQTVRTSLMFY